MSHARVPDPWYLIALYVAGYVLLAWLALGPGIGQHPRGPHIPARAEQTTRE